MTRSARYLPAAAALLLLLAPAPARAWVAAPELGYGRGIVLTPAGDVLTCGQSIGTDGYDFSIRLQRAVDGTDLWLYRLDGSATGFPGSYDSAAEVALDLGGDILAGGSTSNVGTNQDVQVAKLTPDGTALWTRQIDSAAPADDFFEDMAVGPGGDVVVAGTFSGSLFSIVRLAGATGVPHWQHDVPAPAYSRGVTVGFDAGGDVLASGDYVTSAETRDVVAVKLDGATGEERWRTILNGGNAAFDVDEARAAAIDGDGSFYVGVRASTTDGDGFTVYKLSGVTGGVLWRYDHASHDYGETLMLALDGAGHLYAGGDVTGVFVHDRFVLAKLSTASGMPVWTSRMQNLFLTSAAFDPAGDLILAGTNRRGLFTLQKIGAGDGRKRWQRKLPGNLYNGGFAMGVTTDAIGAVYAVGGDVAGLPKPALENGPPSYTVVKACGRDGRTGHTDQCR